MNLSLYEIKEETATTKINCDAVSMYKVFYYALTELKQKEKYIVDLCRINLMEIKPTEVYLNITLIDQDTGEQLEMNVKKGVHHLCIRRGIYPGYLYKILK